MKFDTDLSDDAKTIIQEKLIFLAGTPPVKVTTEEPAVVENEGEKGFLDRAKQRFGSLGQSGSVILWIIVSIIGLFGMIFAWHKIGKSNTASSVPNEKIPPTPEPAPTILSNEANTHEGGPDWLKATESPFGSEDILSKEVSQNQNEVHTPEWM